MSRAARAPGRRPIADILAYAREQPNQALAAGLGIVVVVALAIFGIVHFTGGSSHSDQTAASAAGGNGAQIGPANGGGSAANGGDSSSSSKSPVKGGSLSSGASGPSSSNSSGNSVSTVKGGSGHASTPTTLFVPHVPVTNAAPAAALPKSQQRWVASPSNIHMKAGASTRGWVIVLNESDQTGTVDAPGCSGPPSATPASAVHSCGAGSPLVVRPHNDVKVMWTWHATQTGRAGAPPLAPGSYFFAIGPVNVHVTVK
ncbi:MAG TPA: hypothetical protein VGI86_16155 [Acidimicrobiia bacterium]